MTDIKKINIYMGIVGQAYVDKETAKKNLEAAQKNVQDVEEIINLANQYLREANVSLQNAQDAKTLAQQVYQDLQEKKASIPENSPAYTLLIQLINELGDNDADGNYMNGGNIIAAESNVNDINNLIGELYDILNTAQNLLQDNINYVGECQEAYNNAKDVFESYVPQEQESQSDKSDKLEAELLARLEAVADGIDLANDATDAINRTSAEVQAAANNIINNQGGDEPEPQPQPQPQPVDPTLSFSASSATITDANDYELPTLINENNVNIVWSSTNSSVAAVDSNGHISIIGNGVTNIKAIFTGNDEYNAKEVSYELTINIAQEPEPEPQTKYWFSMGTEPVTAENYTIANNATQVTSYESLYVYTSSEYKSVYILVAADKVVTTDTEVADVDIMDVYSIEDYNVYKTIKIGAGSSFRIHIE